MKATYTFVCLLLTVIVAVCSFCGCSALSVEATGSLPILSDTPESILSTEPDDQATSLLQAESIPQEDSPKIEEGEENEETEKEAPPLEDPPLRAEVPTKTETIQPSFTYPESDYERYTAVCARTGVNVRAGCGMDKAVIGYLGLGRSLPYLETGNGWYKVWLEGTVGYVSAAYTYLADTCRAIERIVGAGLDKLGTPYVWGAPRIINEYGEASPYFTGKSFDCSSFVQYCYYVGDGVKLGIYTGSQADYTVGKVITRYEELRRGDFYFTGNGSISHIVIYMGGGYLLQTYSAYGGPVSFTTDDRWKAKFISGRSVNMTVKEQFAAKATDR